MQKLLIGASDISYPVGCNMDSAINYTARAAHEFNNAFGNTCYLNIICRGSSGAILAALFASAVQASVKKIIHVKKPGESSHSDTVSSYIDRSYINVIIDDFISSGATIRAIWNAISNDTTGRAHIHALVIHNGYREDLGFEPDYLITKY